jgi:hypothetical protein
VGSGRVLECTTGPLQHAGTRLVTTISVDHLSGDTHMIPVKPFMMMALGRGVALWGLCGVFRVTMALQSVGRHSIMCDGNSCIWWLYRQTGTKPTCWAATSA